MVVLAGVAGAALTAWSAEKTYVYNDNVTLGVTVTSIRELGRPALQVRLWASMPQATVADWARSPDPGSDSARGHRVRILASRNGQPMNLTTVEPGAGPLADWLGVYRTTVSNRVFIKQCARVAALFIHMPPQTPADYEITWIIDNSVARVERFRLPGEGVGPASRETATAGPAAGDGIGTYTPGTQLGAPYPLSVAEGHAGGAGVVAASIDPAQAREFLGLGADPTEPVLIGWQPDRAHGVGFLFSEADGAMPGEPSLEPLRDLAPGSWVQAESKPVFLRVTAGGSGETMATLALGPGALVGRGANGNLYFDAGVVRVAALAGPLALVTPAGVIRVDGLALVSVSPNDSRVWCVTELVEFRGKTLRPGSVGRWDGTAMTTGAFAPGEIEEAFLATCFPAAGVPATSTRVTATPQEPAETSVIKRAVLCRAVDARNQPVGAGTRFPAGIQEIVLFVDHDPGPAKSARIRVEIARDGQIELQHEMEVTDSGQFVFSMRSAGPGGFDPGEWELRITVDGALARTLKFTIG